MVPQALGYVGVRAKDLGDWASYGSGLLGLQRIDKSRSTLAFRMDDRKQRIIVDADGGEGIGFFGWEVADAAALDAIAAHLENNGDQGRARRPRAGRRAARQGSDRAQRSARQPARNLPRRRNHSRAVQARPLDLRLPHRAAWPGPCRAQRRLARDHRPADGVLPRHPRLPADGLLRPSFRRALPASQSAPSQPRLHPDRQERRAPHHDGAVQLRRCRPGLRSRFGRRGPRRRDARPPHQRLHHLVL